MKVIYSLFFAGTFSFTFAQQQLENAYGGNNINASVQMIQTNVIVNAGNLNTDNNNEDNNPIQQQYLNYMNNIGNIGQVKQSSNAEKRSNDSVSSGKGIDLSFDFSSRSSSSSSGISFKKTNRRTFRKKLKKFNRNFYGKLALQKKSKHLVDVCFNWSK